jgi:hypothetical protein
LYLFFYLLNTDYFSLTAILTREDSLTTVLKGELRERAMLLNPKTGRPYTKAQSEKLTEEERQAAEQYTEISHTIQDARNDNGNTTIKENLPKVNMISGELISVAHVSAEDTKVFKGQKDRLALEFVSYLNGEFLTFWVYYEMLAKMANKDMILNFNPTEDEIASGTRVKPDALPCRFKVINTVAGNTTFINKDTGKPEYHKKTRQNFAGIYPLSVVAQTADMRIGNAMNVARANDLDKVSTAQILASII